MLNVGTFRWLTFGFIVLLTACRGTTGEPAPVIEEAPVVEAAPPQVLEAEAVVEVEASEIVAKPVVDDVTIPEEVVSENSTVVNEVAEEKEPVAEVAQDMAETQVETVSGPSLEQQQILAQLEVLGPPPELNNEVWLNSDPLKLAELQGKVVVVEFWTFG